MPYTTRLDANERAEIAMKIYEQVEAELRIASGKVHSGEDAKATDKVCKKYHYEPEVVAYRYETSAKVLIVGESTLQIRDIIDAAKAIGIPEDRLDLSYLGYETMKNKGGFAFLKNNSKFTDILTGPIPHKLPGTNGESSMVAEISNHQSEYPKLIKLEIKGSPKITKETLTNGLLQSELFKLLST